jgi:hypothetical protein
MRQALARIEQNHRFSRANDFLILHEGWRRASPNKASTDIRKDFEEAGDDGDRHESHARIVVHRHSRLNFLRLLEWTEP